MYFEKKSLCGFRAWILREKQLFYLNIPKMVKVVTLIITLIMLAPAFKSHK